ncbi:MAG: WD40/YVTN/BNR-like repeat-containing protein [Gaiellaceae bacterium]
MVVDPDELEALVEALIEEARQRARRRRRRRGACIAFAALMAGGVYFGFHRGGGRPADVSAARATSAGAATAARTPGRWGPSGGPDGGPAYTVAVAPSAPEDVYLGTGRGVFRSTNGGRSWTDAGPLPTSESWFLGVTSLVVDPRSPSTVYAGRNWRWSGGMSYGQAVVKSTNGGRTWRPLAVHGQPVAITSTAVYVAAGGLQKTSHLVRSTDAGRSWQPANSGLPSTFVWGLAFDPSTPATGYAAMGKHGVFASNDSGAHWRSVGLSPRYGEVTAITVDPAQPRTLYAAADAGVVVSHDGGHSWHMLNATIGNRGRDRWYMQVSALLVDPGSSDTLYATTRCAGVFKSIDAGRLWRPANAGLKPGCPWAYSLAVDPRAPHTIYAADPTRGALKSIDGASHWQVTNDGLSLAPVSTLAVTPRAIYAGTGALGLFKSRDAGAHWQPLPTGLEAVYSIAVDPGDPAHVLAAGLPSTALPSRAPQLAVSSDAGRTWTTAAFGGRYVSVVAINGQRAYACSGAGLGVFGSTDGGHSWHALGPPGVHYVQALAIDPGDSAVVYAGVYGAAVRGLYKSSDGGSNWQSVTDALNIDVTAVALDPQDPSTVYVATTGGEGGVFKSTDGGTTWQPENSGLRWRVKAHTGKWITPTMAISALAIDPAHPTTLYAATDPRGVYRSTDAGTTWQPFNAGLTDRNITTLALDATGQTVYAGTGDEGVVSLHRSP